jgi:hypothetical protein
VHPDDFVPMLGSQRAHLGGCSSTCDVRLRLRSNGAGCRPMLSRGRVVARDPLGKATRMVGTTLDLMGWASSAANYGLATELPVQARGLPRLPFHTVLGGAPEGQRLVELIDDLLDIALRDANAAL